MAKKVLEVEILNRTGGRYPDSKVFWSFGGTEKSVAQPGYFTAYAAAHGDRADSTAEIFGCGGTLSVNPPLCAALNRHVAKLSPAGQQNPANFYKAAPANYYADFWHKNAIGGKQYGFPYDDDASQSSDISVGSPKYLIVAVGW